MTIEQDILLRAKNDLMGIRDSCLDAINSINEMADGEVPNQAIGSLVALPTRLQNAINRLVVLHDAMTDKF